MKYFCASVAKGREAFGWRTPSSWWIPVTVIGTVYSFLLMLPFYIFFFFLFSYIYLFMYLLFCVFTFSGVYFDTKRKLLLCKCCRKEGKHLAEGLPLLDGCLSLSYVYNILLMLPSHRMRYWVSNKQSLKGQITLSLYPSISNGKIRLLRWKVHAGPSSEAVNSVKWP